MLPEGDTVIRRELSAETGRSRVYVNDTLSSQPTIRDMRNRLVIHTSQHGQQKLLSLPFNQRFSILLSRIKPCWLIARTS